eukprot:COSAG01_NODE_2620_length_7364_cov_25.110805_3_plen_159_part_00
MASCRRVIVFHGGGALVPPPRVGWLYGCTVVLTRSQNRQDSLQEVFSYLKKCTVQPVQPDPTYVFAVYNLCTTLYNLYNLYWTKYHNVNRLSLNGSLNEICCQHRNLNACMHACKGRGAAGHIRLPQIFVRKPLGRILVRGGSKALVIQLSPPLIVVM